MTEEPLPRLYGDFELARLICANETGRIYRGFFRGFRASNVRVFSRQYTCDEAAVQTLRADLQADRVMHNSSPAARATCRSASSRPCSRR
ncbi:hypothetical protein OV079_14475 [Nannocystis pusilla]|uniref:Uncharacterized protein n=1 Tax=Nannocystis pusilla TaxID=889268 RepID=A0A9X3EP89_9BACT|nr:hypothetical protein [Nannocystis pusilla]MCY1006735.1 hypothetical protein [Nannocystis pusilla]